jgi:hypothetical protein
MATSSMGCAMPRQANIKEFISSFSTDRASFMTGPLSIVFAIAALYVNQGWQKVCFVILAIACALFASYSVWKKERAELVIAEERIKPKIRIEYLPGYDAYLGHDKVTTEGHVVIQEQRAIISLRNIGLTSVRNVEVYCCGLDTIRTNANPYNIVYTQGELPRKLDPGVPLWVGIVRQVTAKPPDSDLERRFEIQIPKKVLLPTPPGNEFLITLLVSGEDTAPQNRTFRFGEKNGRLFFEEANLS